MTKGLSIVQYTCSYRSVERRAVWRLALAMRHEPEARGARVGSIRFCFKGAEWHSMWLKLHAAQPRLVAHSLPELNWQSLEDFTGYEVTDAVESPVASRC